MSGAKWVFFYGSYMNRAVLAEAGVEPQHWETARLDGFDLRIEPRANLVPAPDRSVWGILAQLPHDQLIRLYAHAKEVLGEVYLPEAVVVSTSDEEMVPALCYICPSMAPRQPERDYVERILAPAREHGLPESYIRRIEAWLPNVNPTRAQFDRFKELPRDRPIHMLNLIQLRDRAEYPAGHALHGAELSGRDAYRNYGRTSVELFQQVGGRIVWSGEPELVVTGPETERWDIAFIAEYPNATAFFKMIKDPAYAEHVVHRTAAVRESRLIRMSPRPPGAGFGE